MSRSQSRQQRTHRIWKRVQGSGQRQGLWQRPTKDLGCTKREQQNSETLIPPQPLKLQELSLPTAPPERGGPGSSFCPVDRVCELELEPSGQITEAGLGVQARTCLIVGVLTAGDKSAPQLLPREGKARCAESSRVHWMAEALQPPL